jgi:hypothetical protein
MPVAKSKTFAYLVDSAMIRKSPLRHIVERAAAH